MSHPQSSLIVGCNHVLELNTIVFYRLIASCVYYKFQVEIGVTTNQDVYIEIACKV